MSESVSPPPSFKTKGRHYKLAARLRPTARRSEGHRQEPVLIRLDPEPGDTPSEKPPVRIFVGTEPAQYRAERVLIWSITQVRDPSRTYEIYLMKDLSGFDRRTWKTGFTHYRYAIPHLAGGKGRAIYNDVDQIYLADPAELFDMDMGNAGVLSINQKETSVMLLDCEKMAAVWRLEDTAHIHRHKHYRRLAHAAGLWGLMPPEWNARDHEFVPGQSKLFHFTTLHTQPWQPFPDQLKYQPNENAEVWFELERAADEAGFMIWSKAAPSDHYRALLDQYKKMHVANSEKPKRGKRKLFRGQSLERHVETIGQLVRETGAKTILDYGSGKATGYQDSPDHAPGSRHKVKPEWQGAEVICYDPGYEPFAGDYSGRYDGVISTDVLEHIPEEDVPWVIDELFSHSRKFVYAVATCYPAKKSLPNGENAHCTVMPPDWWRGQMEAAARRHAGVKWLLCTKERSFLSLRKRKGVMKKGVKVRYFSNGVPAAAPA
jgi:hypothetical protein